MPDSDQFRTEVSLEEAAKAWKPARRHHSNFTVHTGRTRRRWIFWVQYEYEGPGYSHRWQTPYNVDRWPRTRFWLYRAPDQSPPTPSGEKAAALHGATTALITVASIASIIAIIIGLQIGGVI